MVDSHPDIAIPDESHFVVRYGSVQDRYERPDGFALERFLHDVLNHPWFRRWGLPPETVAASLRASPPASYPDAIRAVFAAYARERGKGRYGDKTPRYVMNMPLLSDLFPESRFLHVIRDGRDVALSHLDAGAGPPTLAGNAWWWKRYILQGRKDGWRLGAQRYREVRYEDVVDDPEHHVREICGFFDLEFHEDMLRYFERADEWVRTPGEARRHRKLYLPPTKGLRDWRREMSREDVAIFEAVAGDLLTELGYERGESRIPLSAKVSAQRDVLRTHRERAARRLQRLRRGLTKSRTRGQGPIAVGDDS